MGKLSNLKIEKLNKPGMLSDGGDGGLWLFVRAKKDGSLSKRWGFRYRRAGVYREIPIGPFPLVSLQAARAKAAEFRAALAEGRDPAAERKAKRRGTTPSTYTFKMTTLDYYESIGQSRWRTPSTGEDWLRGFRLHLWPAIGDRPIDELTDVEVQAALKPIFTARPNLGRKVAERAKQVFDRARVMRHTSKPNPFEWRSHLSYVFPRPPATKHRATIDWRHMPELYAGLVARGDQSVSLAARFMIALALRPNEARLAKFDMLDLEARTLTLPTTKNGSSFVAPLSEAALAVVERCLALRRGDYLFAGMRANRPIHETSILELIQQLCRELFNTHATAHGISRSAFADYAYETNAASDTVIEQALNHSVGNTTTRAYKRGSLLPLRAALMQRYSEFLLGASGNVVAFPKVGSHP